MAANLLITGASGLLGLNLALEAVKAGHQVVGVVHEHLLVDPPFTVCQADLQRKGIFAELLDHYHPDGVIHCAALASLDACEANPEQARRINAELPGMMAEEAGRRGAGFVHISTDAVFDGARGGYSEDDAPNPLGVYSRTKLAGEQAVAAANPDAIIARVNLYGWSLFGRRSLAEFFFNNLTAGNRVNGWTDVYFCPLLVNDLACLLLRMLEKQLAGLYHVVSSESLTKYDFGVLVARQFGLDERLISPVSVGDSGLAAVRSPRLTLDTTKIRAALGETMPAQAEMMARFHSLYEQGYPRWLRALAQQA
jgi:dTDP-4-dehydrorhamnose reductase